ncbi:MAG: hypothetical protein D6771_09450, partial [Zetaproteobacteria bacterium]
EIPFIAGFLYHLLAHDDQQAARLLRIAAERPGASIVARRLAVRFLAKTHGVEEAVRFLLALRQRMPKSQRALIDAKIRDLCHNARCPQKVGWEVGNGQ